MCIRCIRTCAFPKTQRLWQTNLLLWTIFISQILCLVSRTVCIRTSTVHTGHSRPENTIKMKYSFRNQNNTDFFTTSVMWIKQSYSFPTCLPHTTIGILFFFFFSETRKQRRIKSWDINFSWKIKFRSNKLNHVFVICTYDNEIRF